MTLEPSICRYSLVFYDVRAAETFAAEAGRLWRCFADPAGRRNPNLPVDRETGKKLTEKRAKSIKHYRNDFELSMDWLKDAKGKPFISP